MRLTNGRPYGVCGTEKNNPKLIGPPAFLDPAVKELFALFPVVYCFSPMRQMSRGKIIIAGASSKTAFAAFATAAAQPADFTAVNKAFQDHYARGNYPAAQVDAQELERLAKARFGADHPYYAAALNKLGSCFGHKPNTPTRRDSISAWAS
jgi:hypothetical protein